MGGFGASRKLKGDHPVNGESEWAELGGSRSQQSSCPKQDDRG